MTWKIASFPAGKVEIAVVVSNGRGGGRWARPGIIRVVSYPLGMSYRHVRQTGVTALERRDVNMRHRGVRSRYHAVVIEMVAIASRIASVRQREIWEPLRVLAKNALMALDLEPERFSTLLLSGRPLLTQAIQSDFIGTDEDSLRIRVLSMLIEARRVPSSCLSEDSSEPAGPGGRAASLVAAKVGR